MSEQLKNILSHLSTEVDQQALLMYLQGKLSQEKQHELEKKMLDDEFNADALEGLQHLNDEQKISALVEHLNHDLKNITQKKKKARFKNEVTVEPWILITIALILLLVIISYIVIHKQLQ